MRAASIEGATHRLGPPAGMTEDDVHALDVRRDETGFTSAWLPSPEEVAAIFAGAPIHLHVTGAGHPPVLITVGPIPAVVDAIPR